MPGTATDRGLADAFDPMTAIAESASYLADLATEFGNVGLAAAAYNAGPERVRNWLAGTSNLPWETVDYVQFITGRPVEEWKSIETVLPELLEEGQSLQEWCRALPKQKRIYQPVYQPQQATGPARPWGVQLAAHFNRNIALAIFARLKKQYASLLAEQEAMVVRYRNPGFGRKARYAVRVGFDSLAGAEKLCDRLRARGGACGVTKN
jgi:soluble lytic murein transglycosylase-like protein